MVWWVRIIDRTWETMDHARKDVDKMKKEQWTETLTAY